MKTTRIREKIKKFLGDRPRNTAEILEYINSTMRHGTTSQQLGNVLSKDKDIVKVATSSAPGSSQAAMISANGPLETGFPPTVLVGKKELQLSSTMKEMSQPALLRTTVFDSIHSS